MTPAESFMLSSPRVLLLKDLEVWNKDIQEITNSSNMIYDTLPFDNGISTSVTCINKILI